MQHRHVRFVSPVEATRWKPEQCFESLVPDCQPRSEIGAPRAEATSVQSRSEMLADVSSLLLPGADGADIFGGADDGDHVAGGVEDRFRVGQDTQDLSIASHDEPVSAHSRAVADTR